MGLDGHNPIDDLQMRNFDSTAFSPRTLELAKTRHNKTRQETSIRPFVHSTAQLIWTGVVLSATRQEGAATQICVTIHSRERRWRRAGACGWPDWAIVAAVRETI